MLAIRRQPIADQMAADRWTTGVCCPWAYIAERARSVLALPAHHQHARHRGQLRGCRVRTRQSNVPIRAGMTIPGCTWAIVSFVGLRTLVPAAPHGITACLFDLDGVLTQTAKVHAAAWKQMFDAFLLDRSRQTGEPFRPFELRRRLRRSTSTASCGRTACARFWRRAGSRSRRARPTTRRRRRPCTAWARARTTWCSS